MKISRRYCIILTLLAAIATLVAFAQNAIMFVFGLKEGAIFASPFSFTGVFIGQIALIWTGMFIAIRFAQTKKIPLSAVWCVAVLVVAEFMLPISFFSFSIEHIKRKNILDKIELAGSSVEPLASDYEPGSRFALTYYLRFPRAGHYLTFPAYIGRNERSRVFGNYFDKIHSEYYAETFSFEPEKSYEFVVIFDLATAQFDYSVERANIDICDSKDYAMTCRIIEIELGGLIKAALARNPNPIIREPSH